MAIPKPSPPGRTKRATSAGSPSEPKRSPKATTPTGSKRISRANSAPEPKAVEVSAEKLPKAKRTAVKRGRAATADAKPEEQLAPAVEVGGEEVPEEEPPASPGPGPSKKARVAVAKPKRGVVKATAAPAKAKVAAKPAATRGRRAAAPRPPVRRPQRRVVGAAAGGRPVMAPTDINNNTIDEGMLMAPRVDDDSSDSPSDQEAQSPQPGPSRGRGRRRAPSPKKPGMCAASSPAGKCGSFVDRMSQPKHAPAMKKYEPLAHRTCRSVVQKTSPCTPKRDARPSTYGEKPLSGSELESFLTRMSTPRHVTPKAKSDEDSATKKPWF